MKKRIFSLLLVLVMLCGVLPLPSRAVESGFAGTIVNGMAASSDSAAKGPLSLAEVTQENNTVSLTGTTGSTAQPGVSVTTEESETGTGAAGLYNQVDTPAKRQEPAAGDLVTFVVTLEQASLLEAGFSAEEISDGTPAVRNYRAGQELTLNSFIQTLTSAYGDEEGFSIGYTYTASATGLSVTTTYGNKAEIARMPQVKQVYVAPMFKVPEDQVSLAPQTTNASSMIGSNVLNASGYTGKGMRIAILDTGIYLNSPSFAPLSGEQLSNPLTANEIAGVWSRLNASRGNANAQMVYRNTKVPFAYNYNDGNLDESHYGTGSDHGTHVAGIAAANKIETGVGSDVVGVAPEAQLLVMKVFGSSGAGWDVVMAALEDCVYLDVDAVNLSLGATAGFTDIDADMNTVLANLENAGVQVVIASGNDTYNALQNLHGYNMSKLGNPDIGLTSSPGTYSVALSVASVDNDKSSMLYFTVNGKNIGYIDTGNPNTLIRLLNQSGVADYEFVVIDGFGASVTDFEPAAGKIAVVSRGGGLSFTDKQQNAQQAGCKALIIYNNTAGTLNMGINTGADFIPCVSISNTDGAYLAELGAGTLTIATEAMDFQLPKTVSDFSSWGPAPGLILKPEIAGVGGNIYSTRDPSYVSSGYGYMSGTSMATPQIAGAVAVLRQYLEETYPDLTGQEMRTMEAQLLMSTADPVTSNNLPVSPRAQGAGLANLVEATSGAAYLSSSCNDQLRPKGEFGDDPEKTGIYTFPFTVTNLSTETQRYTVDADVITESIANGQYISNSPYGLEAELTVSGSAEGGGLKYDFNGDGQITTADARVLLRHVEAVEMVPSTDLRYDYLDVNGDGAVDQADVRIITDWCAGKSVSVNLLAALDEQQLNIIEVPAGESVTLTATITLTAADKTYLNQFPNGIYVEGFMYLNNQNADGVSLNMPFLGFYGDWSEAPVFDDAEDPSLYGRTIYTWNSTLLGHNPYISSSTRVGDSYNAFSYANPLAELDFGMLRNAKKLAFTVTDVDTGEVYFYREAEHAAKSFYDSTYGMIYPFYIYNANDTENYVWRGLDMRGNRLPDGTTVTYTVEAWVDDGDNIADDSWSFQVTLDSEKPQLLNSGDLQSGVTIDKATGEVTLTLEMQDNANLAALVFMDKNNNLLGRFEVVNEPGKSVTQTFNITGFGPEFTIILGDYACNELEMDVFLELGDYSDTKPQPKELDYGRIYGSEASGLSNLAQGWFSMNKDLTGLRNETGDTTTYFSAEYVNGRIIAQRSDGDLVLLTPYSTYWETYVIQKSALHEGQPGFITYYDMALDYVSHYSGGSSPADRLYAVGWTYAGDTNGDGVDDGTNNLYRIDFSADGSCSSQAIKLTGLSNGAEMLTLACDNNGQLYGISGDCKFYKIDKNTGVCTLVRQLSEFSGKPNYVGLNVVQSMCFDHDNGGIYWMAHSQTRTGGSYIDLCYTYKIDPATGSMEEIGTFGPTGASALFIPTQMTSNLINFTDTQPTGFTLSPNETWLLQGQAVRLEAVWTPWNAQPTQLTWESSASDIASVSTSGTVTGHKAGTATITATAQVLDGAGSWVQATATALIHVTASNDSIYGYIATDDNNNANQFTWVTYSDQNPRVVTQLNRPAISTGSAMWQGGAYYDGYVYTVMADQWTEGNVIYSGTSLYKTKVTETGDDPTQTVFGAPEKIGTTPDIEVGNLGFDYNTGRLYGVDLTHNGLCIIDRTTGSADPVVTFTDPSGTFKTLMTAMAVICRNQETIILCGDMDGKLYTVDPNTGVLTCVYEGNGQEYWYYAAMGYDYNTGNIYWNPSMGSGNNPLNLVVLQENMDGTYTAQVTKIGDVASKYGVEQVVIFTVPDEEPVTSIIPVESIEITNGDIVAMVGATVQLQTVTTPERPTVQTRTWTSSAPDVVSVDHFGVITCKSTGSATITVELEGRSDFINVTVLPSAGQLEAFVVSDENGSGYFDFWLEFNDYAPGKMQATDSMIGVYSMRTGAYFDGDYYVYDNLGKFMRIDAADHTKYTVLGTISDVVSGMAYDYTTNTMYAVTAPSQAYNGPVYGRLCKVDLGTGALTEVAALNAPIHALAADGGGTLYGIGGMLFDDGSSMPTKLYTIDAATGQCTEMPQYTDGLASVNICSDGGMGSFKPQMTYDYTTDRLYISATASDKALAQWGTNSYGLVMIQLGDSPAVSNLGKMAIEIRGSAKTGMLHLGLLCAIPEVTELPSTGTAAAVELNKDYATCTPSGQTQLRAAVKPSGVEQTVTWSSSNDTIATVDQNGLVTGVAPGVVTITASTAGLSDTCQVTVVAATQGSVAYTVTPGEGLIAFNPETPYDYTVVNSAVNGNVVGMDISGNNLYYMVQDPDYASPCIYRYDLMTRLNTFLGCVNAAIVNYSDIAYDEANDILYVTNGYYISGFILSRLSTAQPLSPFREQLLYDTPHAIAVADGTLYAVVREYTVNGTFSSLMTVDFNSNTGEYYSYVKRGLAVDSANNVCEMDYNPATGTLFFSDALNCVYSISLDGETVTPIDCVGDVLEIKGIAIGQ